MKTFVILSMFLLLQASLAKAHTVKTNHVDVNLWSEPARDFGEKIGKVERYEEVEVLQTKKLTNGEIWMKVQLRRLPGWREQKQEGWVDSKFFNYIRNPVLDDQPPAFDCEANCAQCNPRSNSTEKWANQLSAAANGEKQSQARKKRSKFIWPTKGVIRSGFGMRRHPITGVVKLHNGTDIAGNNGKPVLAAMAGTVMMSRGGCRTGVKSCNGGAGNYLEIDHGNGTRTKYMHLSPNCKIPRTGTKLAQGQKIACVGSTGASTGPHLHFGVMINNRYVNPLTVLPSRSEP